MVFTKLRQAAVGTGFVLTLSIVAGVNSANQAGVILAAPPGSASEEQTFDRLLLQPGSADARSSLSGNVSDRAKTLPPSKDTVRRYRDSGRVMFLGGPEAFSL